MAVNSGVLPDAVTAGTTSAVKEPAAAVNEIQPEGTTPSPNVEQSSNQPILGDEPLPPEIIDGDMDARYLWNLWDGLTHCAEPKDSALVMKKLEESFAHTEPEKASSSTEENVEPSEPRMSIEHQMEVDSGSYQIQWNNAGMPVSHPEWPSGFRLAVTFQEDGEHYFQVFKSEDDQYIIDTTKPEDTDFAIPEWKSDTHFVYKFGRKYKFGPAAYDEAGQYIYQHYLHFDRFNYAEHAIMGDRLNLQWSEGSTAKGGDKKLTLQNGNELTYGQINALGGDFFATMNPVCTGESFEEQCRFFTEAYATLGVHAIGRVEAGGIVGLHDREIKAVQGAIDNKTSTTEGYKGLDEKGTKSFGLMTKQDEDLTKLTWDREGPSYIRMAQLNLDHFGTDAHIAYNAGHTCAMRAAAAGDLGLGYAMNAFADHFLGDCFASGHIRTPRRKLHGNTADVQKAIDFILEVVAGKRSIVGGGVLEVAAATSAVAPDLCSKFMHDEDNSIGLWVTNARGDRWIAFGDKKLFDERNAKNAGFMREALQASVDEVYQAFVTKTVPSDSSRFAAWNIAPNGLIDGNHSPLFLPDGRYRKNWEDPKSTKYNDPNSWFKWPPWEGYKKLAVSLSLSNYFKNLE